MAVCGIYKITNKETGQCYVGQSIDIFSRFKQHQINTTNEWHQQLNEHPEKFIFEILEVCEESELNNREVYWISYYDSYHNGYNETKGNYSKINTDVSISIPKTSLSYNYRWCTQDTINILETNSCKKILENIFNFVKTRYNKNEFCIYEYGVDKENFLGQHVEFIPITILQYIDNGNFMAALPFTILIFKQQPILDISEQINYFRSGSCVDFNARPFFIITPRNNDKGYECNCFYQDEIGYDNLYHLQYHYLDF